MIPFVNVNTGNELVGEGDDLVDSLTREVVAHKVRGIPRFVREQENYAESFGWQWQHWHSILSDSRNTQAGAMMHGVLRRRTRFDTYDQEGKTILECGMGGGDDTEVLLDMPFREVHAFDLSGAVDRAAKYLKSSRLVLSQASIFAIPYADRAFDFVFCHRVLQHTPDPEAALRALARKVAPGGVLFVHCYHRSFHFMSQYKYKLRPLTKRLPVTWVASALERWGPKLHRANRALRTRGPLGRALAHNFVPFQHLSSFGDNDEAGLLELEKLLTFDALTPRFDLPMRWPTMKRIIEQEGFRIRFYHDQPTAPLYCTAERLR